MSERTSAEDPHVIAETERWAVVYKPSGWLSIPGRSGVTGTAPVLSEWVRKRLGTVWTVHRLDVETSGVLLFARSADAHRLANQWFSCHETKKTYECLAAGSPPAPMFRIQKAIEGAPCTTLVEVKERFPGCFLAKITPLTGRRHQIRIHLSGEGHPLLGDPRYGGPREIEVGGQTLLLSRVALHAARLELPTKEVFEASRPADFEGWLRVLRAGGTHG